MRRQKPSERMAKYSAGALQDPQPQIEGYLTRAVGMALEAVGLNAPLGARCEIDIAEGATIEAEVVGFAEEKIFLKPIGEIEGITPGSTVRPIKHDNGVPVGMGMLGRVIDGTGKPIDGKGPLQSDANVDLNASVINPLQRKPIDSVLDVGIRAINSLLTIGKGQRMGLFAGSGVGKSVLMGMMTKFTTADIVVVGLVGERGREVKEFIDQILGEEGLKRAIVIASPADDVPLMRLRAAMLATRISEYFRDQGKDVLLLMDSLTRFAQAQRQIALAIGEPPATKGYPPSVFAKIPQLVERAGNSADGEGSVTAFYTVLTEGDDLQDPVADAARAILDGHIVLSRQLADEGHYPAIDVEMSISRVMPNVIDARMLQTAQRFKQLYSRYQQSRDLISVGAYVAGSDPETDMAIEKMPSFKLFLRQGLSEAVSFKDASQAMQSLVSQKAIEPSQAQPPVQTPQ